MWYLVKFFLKIQVDKIYLFIVVRVICVHDLGKEIGLACHAATFVSESMLRLPVRFLISMCVISLSLTDLSMVLQTTEVRLLGL